MRGGSFTMLRAMIALIARLYGIEKAVRDGKLTAEARHELRRQGAPAILQAIHTRLIALESGRINSLILPKSPLGKAIGYVLGQWTALQRYLEEGAFMRSIIIGLRTPFAPPVLGRRTGPSLGTRTQDGGVR